MKLQLLAGSAIVSGSFRRAGAQDHSPSGRTHPGAFVITEGATMIDFAGRWEVFQDVMVGDGMPFRLYSRPARSPRHASAAQGLGVVGSGVRNLGDTCRILQGRCASMVLRSSFSCLRSSPVGSAAAKSSVS